MLKAIERSGIDFILSSPGSEWPPMWEALAEAAARGAGQPLRVRIALRDRGIAHRRIAVSLRGS